MDYTLTFLNRVADYNNPNSLNFKNKKILFSPLFELVFDKDQAYLLFHKFWFLINNLDLDDLIAFDFRFFYSTKYGFFVFDFKQKDFIYLVSNDFYKYFDKKDTLQKIQKVNFEVTYKIPIETHSILGKFELINYIKNEFYDSNKESALSIINYNEVLICKNKHLFLKTYFKKGTEIKCIQFEDIKKKLAETKNHCIDFCYF
ncbi:hypothetical protein [Carp edema virus]|nr:hypothetical protein [Carp edema virus]